MVYPNPFSQYAHIEFSTLKDGLTSLEIIDEQGRSEPDNFDMVITDIYVTNAKFCNIMANTVT